MNKIGQENTSMNLWWPRIVGLVLAVFMVGASAIPLLPFVSLPVLLVGVVVTAAIAFFWKGIAGVIAVRWCARTVGVGTALFVAAFIIAESVGGEGPGITTIMGWVSVFMLVVVFVGIVITFFWEGIGGMLVALAALALDMMSSFHLNLFCLPLVIVGLASIYFANKYPESKIVAIEPEESNFKLLKINVCPYANIIPLQAALWDKNEEISLVDPGLGKNGFMTEENGNKEHHGNFCHHTQGKTVDRIMQDYDLQRIDILKIDIEGAEKEVFSDASSWIGKVDGVIIELHERMKSGCNCSFYNGSNGFDDEWKQGENVYLSRRNCLTRRST